MADFERRFPEPALSPSDPLTRFFSLLLEDYGDEWLWRPALHYRCSFDEDMTLMSAQIARTMLRDVKLPFWARRQFILRRQRRVYLSEDGVTKETIPQIEALYLDTLDAMEAVLTKRPFLMGERPVEADFGFFGSMFRHFSSDPTPAAIMRARAPHVLLWVARLWAARPKDIEHAALPAQVPDDLAPFLARMAGEYFPYLAANEAALARGERRVLYDQNGVRWSVPASPYRAYCLGALRRHFRALGEDAREKAVALLGNGAKLLAGEDLYSAPPIHGGARDKPLDRHWSGAAQEGRT
jgi:glutathione S-transferase